MKSPNDAIEAASDFMGMMISKVYAEYQKVLLKNHALDFDDLIMTTIQLFERVLKYWTTTSRSFSIFMWTSIGIRIKRSIFS